MGNPSDVEKYPWWYEKHEDWSKRISALNQSLKQRSNVKLEPSQKGSSVLTEDKVSVEFVTYEASIIAK